MTAAPSRRVPLQRPFVGALAVVIERAREQGGERPYGDRPWVDLARARGVYALVDLSEKRWHEAQSQIVATDDRKYVGAVADALTSMLQGLLWTVTLRSNGEVPTSLRERGPASWLVGAWPVQQPRTTPKTLEWPSPFGMSEPQLIASMQNAALHMAYALCKRLDKMGVEPPAIEVAA